MSRNVELLDGFAKTVLHFLNLVGGAARVIVFQHTQRCAENPKQVDVAAVRHLGLDAGGAGMESRLVVR